MIKTTLGERISTILLEQNLKKVTFANILGISANYVSLLAGGRKTVISEPLAKLIESIFGYRAEWVMTGELPVHLDDNAPDLHEDTMNHINRMDGHELRAVAAFIHSLDGFEVR
jgi:transcriptional regulator with XRE-family HTH domain